jgi:hypothetical protein
VILVPRGVEYAAVRRGCSGACASPSILAVPPGRAAASVLDDLAGTHFVILGLGGALDPALRVGEVVACESVSHAGRSLEFDPGLTADLVAASGARRGRALTVDHVVTRRSEREALYRSSRAQIAEMEGFFLTQPLIEQGRTVAMVRVVSDDVRCDLPSIGAAIGPDGNLRLATLAAALVASPRRSWRFIVDVRRSLAVLQRTTARLISR